jgi:hypothetical protein
VSGGMKINSKGKILVDSVDTLYNNKTTVLGWDDKENWVNLANFCQNLMMPSEKPMDFLLIHAIIS